MKGTKIIGLLVDPGACRGLIGSESLREIFEECLKPAGRMKTITWTPSNSTFSGISSTNEQFMGICEFDMGLPYVNEARFRADVIGGDSSLCPGLIPLISIVNTRCFLSFGYYPNGDGLLGMRISGRLVALRILLTDSGHYLLPLGHFTNNPHWPGHVAKEDYAFLKKIVLNDMSRGGAPVFYEGKEPMEQDAIDEMVELVSRWKSRENGSSLSNQLSLDLARSSNEPGSTTVLTAVHASNDDDDESKIVHSNDKIFL